MVFPGLGTLICIRRLTGFRVRCLGSGAPSCLAVSLAGGFGHFRHWAPKGPHQDIFGADNFGDVCTFR